MAPEEMAKRIAQLETQLAVARRTITLLLKARMDAADRLVRLAADQMTEAAKKEPT